MIWWLIVAMLLGAVSYGLIQPHWTAWQSLPRENQQERRRRRCRLARRKADSLLADGHPRLALHAARRAHRIDPSDSRTVWGLGLALAACRRYEAAVKHFEEAYDVMESTDDEDLPHMAVAAARCCARLRNDAPTPLKAETLAEQVLSWTRVAARQDAAAAEILADDPLLRDLCGQVRLLHASEVSP